MSFTRDAVSTSNAPGAIGPYSQAIKANGFVFVSGQVPIDPATGTIVSGGVEQQTEHVLKNLAAVPAAAGRSWAKIVDPPVFFKNITPSSSLHTPSSKIPHN